MMEYQNAKERTQRQVCLSYAERRSISMMEHQNAKMQKRKGVSAEASLLKLGLSFFKNNAILSQK
jgi:hypothetical protein